MTTWLCPACLAPSEADRVTCEACRAWLVLDGRFVVLEPLASHGSARTLGGQERDSGRPVVIKMLSVSGLVDWKQLELFQRGIGVLRGLSHPGIPQHLADGELTRGGETIYYWVQQRMPGRTLAEGLAQGQRWTDARARALADAVLEILEYLQSFSPPILHRDLKPSNVIERPGDQGWALIDFDLVKDTLDPEGSETTALGTAGYAPLEQLMGRAVPASDLYGLGATLVALLSRKSPADLLDADASRLEFRPHVRVSEAFAGFLDALLDPRVTQRPADARAARARLRAAVSEVEARPVERAAVERVAIERVASVREAPRREALVVSAPGLAGARAGLLRVLMARALAGGPRTSAPGGGALVATGPASRPVVIVQPKLAEDHPAPWWVAVARLSLLAATAVAVPASGAVLGVMLAVSWIVSGFVVRYPVRLGPGRALFKGGLGNTATPGVYWLRKRWREKPCSISLAPLHLDWRPTATGIAQGERHAWLELSLELWVVPRTDELGQFVALLQYQGWQANPLHAARRLRDEVLDAVIEHVKDERLLERAASSPLRLDARVHAAIDRGLHELGLERVALGEHAIVLRPRTEDLSREDRLWIDERPPAARRLGVSSGR